MDDVDSCMYEIISKGQFEIVLERRTFETATGVLYTKDDLKALFNNGNNFLYCMDGVGSYPMVCDYAHDPSSLIYVDSVLAHVLNELKNPKKKEVFVDLSPVAIRTLSVQYQRWFKENGVMCRPSTGVFIRFKQKPKKVAVDKFSLLQMKRECVRSLQYFLNTEYDICLEFKDLTTELRLRNYIKFGMTLGRTIDVILEDPNFTHTYEYVDDGKGKIRKRVGCSLDWFVANEMTKHDTNKEEMCKLMKQSFREWLEEIVLL